MSNSLVSVIIPAFNAEKTISVCINSVINQTYNNVEVIVVDDGSIDRTLNIVKGLASKYKNIHIKTQDNSGPSVARNTGIEIASGVYIMFIDADDTLERNAIKELVFFADSNNADVVSFDFIVKNQNNVIIPRTTILRNDFPNKNVVSSNTFFRYINSNAVGNFIWALFLRRDFLNKNGIRFNSELSIMEDAVVMDQILHNIKYIYIYYKKPLYFYSYIDTSLSHKMSQDRILSGINAIDSIFSNHIGCKDILFYNRIVSDLFFLYNAALRYNDERLCSIIRSRIISVGLLRISSMKLRIKYIFVLLHVYGFLYSLYSRKSLS